MERISADASISEITRMRMNGREPVYEVGEEKGLDELLMELDLTDLPARPTRVDEEEGPVYRLPSPSLSAPTPMNQPLPNSLSARMTAGNDSFKY